MKRRSFYVFLAASLAVLIPAPGRFIYGLILILELNFLMLFGTMFYSMFNKLKLNSISTYLTMSCVIGLAVCYKQMINFICPEISLTLGFIFYLVPVSIFFVGYVFSNEKGTLGQRVKVNMIHIITFSIYALIFFLVRDLFGFGTFTFIGANAQIIEIIILPPEKIGVLMFLASIPGALICSSIVLIHHILIRNKFNILRNSEAAE